ncbi:4-hydroxyphenylacetate 3-hydroxylase N-terminal domain-containing protein [Orrella sp. JC864]|uniref:4-hydroxyphenylacetate 3-hydroxylase N-terminal domain-containing protein n=1 Tax=Orrella sp. JC864 TaxID=3120298 RepID=UPI00300AE5C3
MIRTGEQYRQSLRDGRDVRLDGQRVADVAAHPVFKPLVDTRARLYDLQHAPASRDVLSFDDGVERHAIGNKLPLTKQDWWDKRRAMDALMQAAGGWAARLGSESAGEMWSLFDGQDVLNDMDPAYRANLRAHIHHVLHEDPFLVCADSDQAKAPLHVVRDTDAGLVVRGVARDTAAAYADRAFVRPGAAWQAQRAPAARAVGFVCDLGAPGVGLHCSARGAARQDGEPSVLARHLDEVPTDIVFDDALIPWEQVLFYRHAGAVEFVRATQSRYSGFSRLQRGLALADMLAGAALLAARLAGTEAQAQGALVRLAAYREAIHAHLTAAITLAEPSPAGLMMPNQSLLHAGLALAGAGLGETAAAARALCAALHEPAHAAPQQAAGPGRLLAYARDVLDSRYLAELAAAGAPPCDGLAPCQHALQAHFDWGRPLAVAAGAAGMAV